MMEPKVAFTTAPTAKLLWAEMLQIHKGGNTEFYMSDTRQNKHSAQVCSKLMKNKPGNPHTNIIGQGYDGADGYGELDIRAGKPVVFVNVSNNHGDNHQRKEV